MASEHFYYSAWFVNQYILTFASHNQLRMFSFSDEVNLLGSTHGIALPSHDK